jgi:hypothetical protein
MKRSYFLVLLLLTYLAGCSTKLPIPGCQSNGMAVRDTWVQYGTCRDDLIIVVWSDIADLTGKSGGVTDGSHALPSANRVDLGGLRHTDGGRKVDWQVVTADGKTGPVTVNNMEYRLEDGAIFLVRTKGGAAKVIQVKLDLSRMKPGVETWERLARESPEIKEFMDQTGDKK